jgi:hypothetical protein
MREQAALLGRKTKNLVEAKVATSVLLGGFTAHFNLVVPALGNYTYELFKVRHGVEPYPVEVPLEIPHPALSLKSEEEFVSWLQQTLSSPKTKRIVSNLLAQATS